MFWLVETRAVVEFAVVSLNTVEVHPIPASLFWFVEFVLTHNGK